MSTSIGKKVFVGMSGGVDSSVAAALLKEQGYAVTGVFIKVWDAPWLPCNWREERRSAMRTAAKLQIPFHTLDLEKEYKEGVVDYMIHEYSEGRVPNPDVFCNKIIKFGGFFEYARNHGADFVATGHYARTEMRNAFTRLLAAHDPKKEQSYFLWNISPQVLPRIIFPVGDLLKSEVREHAARFALPSATKKDSQGICFLGQVSVPEFLAHYVKAEKGDVLNEEGVVIGEHDGALIYTIGQRHGFRIHDKQAEAEPLYVISKNMEQNTITVGQRTDGATSAVVNGCILREMNFIAPMGEWTGDGEIVIRYHGERIPLAQMAHVEGGVRCVFMHPVADVALGQSGVYYRKDECMGGGIIAEVF